MNSTAVEWAWFILGMLAGVMVMAAADLATWLYQCGKGKVFLRK